MAFPAPLNPWEARNQSGDLSVPPTALLPSGRADGTAMHDRDVTANVSIPSVGDLSGRRIYIEDIYPARRCRPFPDQTNCRRGGGGLGRYLSGRSCCPCRRVVVAARSREQMVSRSYASAPERPLVGKLYAGEVLADTFTPSKPGPTMFATWRRDFIAKREAGMDVALEIAEGRNILMSLKFAQCRPGPPHSRGLPGPRPEHPTFALLSDELAGGGRQGHAVRPDAAVRTTRCWRTDRLRAPERGTR